MAFGSSAVDSNVVACSATATAKSAIGASLTTSLVVTPVPSVWFNLDSSSTALSECIPLSNTVFEKSTSASVRSETIEPITDRTASTRCSVVSCLSLASAVLGSNVCDPNGDAVGLASLALVGCKRGFVPSTRANLARPIDANTPFPVVAAAADEEETTLAFFFFFPALEPCTPPLEPCTPPLPSAPWYSYLRSATRNSGYCSRISP